MGIFHPDTSQSTKGTGAPVFGGGLTKSGGSHDPTSISHGFSKGGASGPGLLQDTPVGGGAGRSGAASLPIATGSSSSVAAALKFERSTEGNS